MNKRRWRKAALVFSCCLFILWWALGAGATLAWFSDTETVRNTFQFGTLDVEVDYWDLIQEDYLDLEGATEVFDDHALYEPGYTQVVYLRIDNLGDVPFRYKVAVTVKDFVKGKNAWGEDIYLPNFLRYGVVFAKDEAELKKMVQDRISSREHAAEDWGTLGTWSKYSDLVFEVEDEFHYAALIVHMPEEVGNAANYRGLDQPRVDLGITVLAQQENAPIEE